MNHKLLITLRKNGYVERDIRNKTRTDNRMDNWKKSITAPDGKMTDNWTDNGTQITGHG